jgi:hypothetical protein
MYQRPSSEEQSESADGLGYLAPEETQSRLAALGRATLNTVDTAATVLDTPGAITRGILAGKPLSGFSFDSADRVSGQELLTQYGLLKKDDNPYYRYLTGLASEIVLDPFALANMPLRALGMGGKAAKAAGIIGDAPLAALSRMGGGDLAKGVEVARKTWTGRNAYQFLGDLMPTTRRAADGTPNVSKALLTPDNLRIRPMVGQRSAQATTTLEETIKASADPNAFAKVKAYLDKKGIDYDSVKGEKLGGALSLDFYGLHKPLVWNPKGAAPYLDALDALGQAGRWSSLSRGVSALTNSKVNGEFKAADQFFELRNAARAASDEAAGRVKAGKNAALVNSVELPEPAQKLLGASSLNSTEGMRFLSRMYEGAQTVSDMRLKQAIGNNTIDSIVKNWDDIRTDMFTTAKSLGYKSQNMRDMFGLRFTPYRLREGAEFGEYGTGLSRTRYNTNTLHNQARERYLQTPGGVVERQDLSVLPEVAKFVKEGEQSNLSVSDIGDAVKRLVDTRHGPNAVDPRVVKFKTFVPKIDPTTGKAMTRPVIDPLTGVQKLNKQGVPVSKVVYDPTQVISKSKGDNIARFLMRKNPALPADLPMFSESPLVSQASAIDALSTAKSNAKEIYYSMGEAVIHAGAGRSANAIPGARLKPVDQAINEIAKATGLNVSNKTGVASDVVRDNLKQSIGRLHGIQNWQNINLSEYAIPETVYNRLTRVSDFYNSPRAQQGILDLFDQFTAVFKGFGLAFPSTKIRDIYSNGFLVWAETGSVDDTLFGFKAARAVVAGEYDTFAAIVKEELPGYNRATVDAIKNKMVTDVSRTGVLKTLATNDVLTSNRTGELNQLVPGSAPMGRWDFFKEMKPDGSRSLGQIAADQFNLRGVQFPWQKYKGFQTTNAMLNASEKASEYSDVVARLGGMFALMRKGVSADEAATRITRALVDYSSLTGFERNVMRRLLPWYAYNSRAGAHIVNNLLSKPGGAYAQTLRASRLAGESDEDTYIPEALRQQLAVRVPDALKPYLGIPQNANTTTFFKDFDIPGVDTLNLLGRAPTTYGSVQSTASNLAQQANPLWRALYELGTGEDSFSRRPLDQAVTPLDRIYRRLSKSETSMNPLVRMVINTVPGPHQRLISVVGGMADDRIPMQQRAAKQLFNSLAGIKIQDVDPEWQLQDARRQLEGRLSGYMQDYTESYVPKKVLPQLPAELTPDYLLFRSLGKELRERRKARAQ